MVSSQERKLKAKGRLLPLIQNFEQKLIYISYLKKKVNTYEKPADLKQCQLLLWQHHYRRLVMLGAVADVAFEVVYQ